MQRIIHRGLRPVRRSAAAPSRSVLLAICLSAILLPAGGQAAGAQAAKGVPTYDATANAPSRTPRVLTAAEKHLIRTGTDVRYDPALGVPTFVWTTPSGAAQRRMRSGDPADEARRHLSRIASLYDLDAADIAATRVSQIHDTGSGPIIVKFRKDIDGVEVFREEVSVLMNRDLESIAASGFVSGAPARSQRSASSAFVLAAEDAAAAAIIDRSGDQAFSAGDLSATGPRQGPYETWDYRAGRAGRARRGGANLNAPARTKPVYFHDASGYRASYYVEVSAEVTDASGSINNDAVAYVIAADNGEILFRHDLTVRDSFSYRVHAATTGEKAPAADPYGGASMPHPTGVVNSGFAPAYVAASFVTLQNGPILTNDAWLAPGSTETQGNNVDAYADLNAPDGFNAGDLRASTTSAGTFDRAYDFDAEPDANTTQQAASVTQAFYTTNYLHDAFYDHGFDEAAGNGQVDNYGRGGIAGDPLLAQAQDYSGTDNADMTTPSDGASPRMQMYPWTGVITADLTVNSPSLPPSPFGIAAFGLTSFSTTGDVVLVNDGSGTTTDGCQAIVNSVAGKIALIDRGSCDFTQKTENAVAAGAIAVLIANNVGTTEVFGMSGSCTGPCNVGAFLISHDRGAELVAALSMGTVNVSMARTSGVSRDGSFDGDTVAHEWGHFLSNRLVGDGNGLVTTQSVGMGEGWADFNALLMSVEEGDSLSAIYPVSTYVSVSFSSDSTYFGLRRVPYSTDMTKDPLTFRHIGNGAAITGVPCSSGCAGTNNAEVHNTGEVWATMLWECYAALLGDTLGGTPRLTFDQAKQRMRAYLVASLKMTPVAPTFTEARDAVLAAAAANDPADAQLFCTAFAKRGIGQGAVPPSSNSPTNAGVVESFVCAPPATCAAAPRNDCSSAAKGQVKMQGNAGDPSKQSMSWKWSSGTANLADFGDPASGSTNYSLCVYDDDNLAMTAGLAAGNSCGNKPCWKVSTSGFSYKNSTGNSEGLIQVKMKAGSGNAQVQVKGKGAGLALPFPLTDATAVTVQLVKDAASGTECWSSEFASPATRLDGVTLTFQDRAP